MGKILIFLLVIAVPSLALADPLADAQAVCKSHIVGQNAINRVGQPSVTWPAYDRPECDDLEALTNQNVPPDPNRHLDQRDVEAAVMALATGIHPVTLTAAAKASCVAQGYANIGAETARSSGDSATLSAMSEASTAAGQRCIW